MSIIRKHGWDYLPNEILDKIITMLEGKSEDDSKESTRTMWMFVNRQWFDWNQKKQYKEVSVNLNMSENMKVKSILYSPFQPGKWVKTINFTSLIAPANHDTLNLEGDPLYQMILCCPNTEEVKMPMNIGINKEGWTYFTTAVLSSSSWKLRRLGVEEQTLDQHCRNYYSCIYSMRKSLTEMILVHGMIVGSYSCLQEFFNLTTLTIGKDVVNDLQGCSKLLNFLPKLITIKVIFSNRRQILGDRQNVRTENANCNDTVQSSAGRDKKAKDAQRTSLQAMHLEGYSPALVEDVLQLKNFTYLEHVKISLQRTANVTEAMVRLFGLLVASTYKTYDVLCRVDNEVHFFETFYDSIKHTKRSKKSNHFSLHIIFCDYKSDADEQTTIKICKTEAFNTRLEYSLQFAEHLDDMEAQTNNVKRILSSENNLIQKLELRMLEENAVDPDDNSSEIGEYITSIANYKKLSTLLITKGVLDEIIQDSLPGIQEIKTIKFYDCTINNEVLPFISSRFFALKDVCFHGCIFEDPLENLEDYNISMPNMTAGTITLIEEEGGRLEQTFSPARDNMLLVSIHLLEPDTLKQYICGNGVVSEVQSGIFNRLLNCLLDCELCTLVKITARSITTFSVKVVNRKDESIRYETQVSLAF